MIGSKIRNLCNFRLKIKVVLISSYLDAHHHPVYPTPAFITKRQYPNLLCVSDPCVLDINGVIVGATSNDTLFYLTREEISRYIVIVKN